MNLRENGVIIEFSGFMINNDFLTWQTVGQFALGGAAIGLPIGGVLGSSGGVPGVAAGAATGTGLGGGFGALTGFHFSLWGEVFDNEWEVSYTDSYYVVARCGKLKVIYLGRTSSITSNNNDIYLGK